jgi:hypothetical protein
VNDKTTPVHPTDWLLSHPTVDLVVAVPFSLVLLATAVHDGTDPLSKLLAGERQIAYGTIATSAAALLGFGVTAMAIFIALVPGARLKRLLERRGATVRRIFFSTISALAVLTAVGVAGTIFDASTHETWLRAIAYGALLVAAARVARMLWLFSNLVSIGTRDRDEGTTDPSQTPMNLRH